MTQPAIATTAAAAATPMAAATATAAATTVSGESEGGPDPTGLELDHSPHYSDRELDVLRLLARGLSTREVAHTLSYSERTIKNVIYGLTTRTGLRNRTHAVAVAVRIGLV